MMQRPPAYGPQYPGAPMNNGYGPPQNPGFGPGRPGQPGPVFGGPQMPPGPPQNPGCFMPAATIRKISNTTPPVFDPPRF